MIRRQNSHITTDIKKVSWLDTRSSQPKLSLKPKPIIQINFLKAERGEEVAEEKFKVTSGWFIRFKERSHLHNIKVQGEAANAEGEAAASYPGLIKTVYEGGFIKQQIFNVDKPDFC